MLVDVRMEVHGMSTDTHLSRSSTSCIAVPFGWSALEFLNTSCCTDLPVHSREGVPSCTPAPPFCHGGVQAGCKVLWRGSPKDAIG